MADNIVTIVSFQLDTTSKKTLQRLAKSLRLLKQSIKEQPWNDEIKTVQRLLRRVVLDSKLVIKPNTSGDNNGSVSGT